MPKLGKQAREWRATVDAVTRRLLAEHGVEAFWMAERFRRRHDLTEKERQLSEAVFAEVERRTRGVRSAASARTRSFSHTSA
jgi:hypothetical protein